MKLLMGQQRHAATPKEVTNSMAESSRWIREGEYLDLKTGFGHAKDLLVAAC